MFDKENYTTDAIIRAISRLPLYQAHFTLMMGGLGGLLFIVGFAQGAQLLKQLPTPAVLMLLGLLAFTLFFPMSHIVYLAKELQESKDRIKRLEQISDRN